MIIHDVVIFDGKTYKAVKPKSEADRCIGCQFDMPKFQFGCGVMNCSPSERKDGCDVIYKPHYRLGVKP